MRTARFCLRTNRLLNNNNKTTFIFSNILEIKHDIPHNLQNRMHALRKYKKYVQNYFLLNNLILVNSLS